MESGQDSIKEVKILWIKRSLDRPYISGKLRRLVLWCVTSLIKLGDGVKKLKNFTQNSTLLYRVQLLGRAQLGHIF
jgi:hypothetical protein